MTELASHSITHAHLEINATNKSKYINHTTKYKATPLSKQKEIVRHGSHEYQNREQLNTATIRPLAQVRSQNARLAIHASYCALTASPDVFFIMQITDSNFYHWIS